MTGPTRDDEGAVAVEQPHWWLGSNEHPYWATPRSVTVRRRLTGPGGRVAVVVELDPPAQSVHDDEPRSRWLLTTRYAGDSLDHVDRGPVDVHVLRPKDDSLLQGDQFVEGAVTIEAWAELYPTREAAAATTGGA